MVARQCSHLTPFFFFLKKRLGISLGIVSTYGTNVYLTHSLRENNSLHPSGQDILMADRSSCHAVPPTMVTWLCAESRNRGPWLPRAGPS